MTHKNVHIEPTEEIFYRVGQFWSSSRPGKAVLCIASSQDEVDRWELRGDFIKWLPPDNTVQELQGQVENLKIALVEWFAKTEWVQATLAPKELGYHLADVLRNRIEELQAKCDAQQVFCAEHEAEVAELVEALEDIGEWINTLPAGTKEATTKGKMIDALLTRAKEYLK